MREPQPYRLQGWHGRTGHDLTRAGRPYHAEEHR